jgi:hypothetical protein
MLGFEERSKGAERHAAMADGRFLYGRCFR